MTTTLKYVEYKNGRILHIFKAYFSNKYIIIFLFEIFYGTVAGNLYSCCRIVIREVKMIFDKEK